MKYIFIILLNFLSFPLYGQIASEWFTQGNMLVGKNDLKGAINAFSNAITLNYTPLQDALVARGDVYARLKSKENEYKAIADYTKVLELNVLDYQIYKKIADAYARLGLYDTAIQNYDEAIRIAPQIADMYFQRGINKWYATTLNVVQKESLLRSAIQDFSTTIQLEPTNWRAYSRRCKMKMDLGLYSEALADNQQALKLNIEGDTLNNNQGDIYFHLKDYENAIVYYTKAIHYTNSSKAIYPVIYRFRAYSHLMSGNISSANTDLLKAYELSEKKEDKDEIQGTLAYNLFIKGNSKDAVKLLDELIEDSPNHAIFFYLRAIARMYRMPPEISANMPNLIQTFVQKDYAEYNKQAATISTIQVEKMGNIDSLEASLNNEQSMKSVQEGLADLDKAIKLDTNRDLEYIPYFLRAVLKLYTQDISGLSDITTYINHNPNIAEGYGIRIRYHIVNEDYAAAEKDCRRAMQLNPNDFRSYADLGEILIDGVGDYEGGINAYNQAIALSPNNIMLYQIRGEVFFNQEDYTKAIDDLDKVMKYEINCDPINCFYRGISLVMTGKRYEQAAKDISTALFDEDNTKKQEAFLYYLRGKAYFEQKKYSQAINDYEMAQQLKYSFESMEFPFKDYYNQAQKSNKH